MDMKRLRSRPAGDARPGRAGDGRYSGGDDRNQRFGNGSVDAGARYRQRQRRRRNQRTERRRRGGEEQRDLRPHRRRARKRPASPAATSHCRRITSTTIRSRTSSRRTPGGERYGYTVSREFNVKVRDIGKAGRVADACTSSGATSINGVTFGLADSSGARSEATPKSGCRRARERRGAGRGGALAHRLHQERGACAAAASNPQPLMRMAAANAPTQFDQSNVNVSVR